MLIILDQILSRLKLQCLNHIALRPFNPCVYWWKEGDLPQPDMENTEILDCVILLTRIFIISKMNFQTINICQIYSLNIFLFCGHFEQHVCENFKCQ